MIIPIKALIIPIKALIIPIKALDPLGKTRLQANILINPHEKVNQVGILHEVAVVLPYLQFRRILFCDF